MPSLARKASVLLQLGARWTLSASFACTALPMGPFRFFRLAARRHSDLNRHALCVRRLVVLAVGLVLAALAVLRARRCPELG